MKRLSIIIAAGILAASLYPAAADAASLLGGLVKIGSDSGNSSGLVSIGNGSVGVGGSNGVSVNLGNSGGLGSGLGSGSGSGGGSGLLGSGTGGLLGSGSGGIGIPGVAEISTGSGQGGSGLTGTLLGGGHDLTLNPLGLLGNNGGITVGLPGLGGLLGTDGTDGTNGTNGTNGISGGNGIVYYSTGGGYPGGVVPGTLSARLRLLLQILQDRDFLRVSDGRAICLNSFGVAQIGGWLPARDFPSFYKILPAYAPDIKALRQLLGNCRTGTQRQALNGQLERVITLDIRADGTPVLFEL